VKTWLRLGGEKEAIDKGGPALLERLRNGARRENSEGRGRGAERLEERTGGGETDSFINAGGVQSACIKKA